MTDGKNRVLAYRLTSVVDESDYESISGGCRDGRKDTYGPNRIKTGQPNNPDNAVFYEFD